jgi:hypothetical protein
MEFLGTDNSFDVIAINATKKELQVVIEKNYEVRISSIIVLQIDDSRGQEILGIVNEVEHNDEHTIIYVDINPNQSTPNQLSKLKIKSILLWGAL